MHNMIQFLPMMTKKSLVPKRPIHNIKFTDKQTRMSFNQNRRHCWNDYQGERYRRRSNVELGEMVDAFDVRCSNCMYEQNMYCLLKEEKKEDDWHPCENWDLKVLEW